MKTFTVVLLAILGSILFYITGDFPFVGDSSSPPSKNLSPFYLENALEDTKAPNVVSAVLADYRGFDTMLETTVVVAGGLAVLLILFMAPGQENERALVVGDESSQAILKVVSRLLIPPIQLFALYVLVHGHYSPGGGFQGGVIFGATLILHAIAFGLDPTLDRFNKFYSISLAYWGVAIYAFIGLLAVFLGSSFLDYGALVGIFNMDKASMRSLAILGIETGVAISVALVMYVIYVALISRGTFKGRSS